MVSDFHPSFARASGRANQGTSTFVVSIPDSRPPHNIASYRNFLPKSQRQSDAIGRSKGSVTAEIGLGSGDA